MPSRGTCSSAATYGRLINNRCVSKQRVLRDLWQFVKQERKYWLAPLIFVLVILSLLMVFSQSSVIGPFIYTLF